VTRHSIGLPATNTPSRSLVAPVGYLPLRRSLPRRAKFLRNTTLVFGQAEQVALAVDTFFTFFQKRMCAFPETLSVLRKLRAAGVRLGALTDVPYGMPHKFVEGDLDRADISQFMDAVVTSAMVGVRKPEVAGYHALATSLAVKPDEMLYVGNEPKDVMGAQRAGVPSAFLDRTGAGGNHGQSFTISSLSAIHEIMCTAV
jgi:putative hydrolase of the HAD superfamily